MGEHFPPSSLGMSLGPHGLPQHHFHQLPHQPGFSVPPIMKFEWQWWCSPQTICNWHCYGINYKQTFEKLHDNFYAPCHVEFCKYTKRKCSSQFMYLNVDSECIKTFYNHQYQFKPRVGAVKISPATIECRVLQKCTRHKFNRQLKRFKLNFSCSCGFRKFELML